MRWPRFLDVPENLIVELTNVCNLRCPVCPTIFGMTRARGFMKFEVFRDLLDNLHKHGLRPRLRFTLAGEPMLHKEIADFIDYAHRLQFRTDISTNATIYRKFNKQPSKMTVCLDGSTKEAHESYRVGSDFFQVEENIRKLVRENQGTQFTLQHLVTKWSEGQAEEVVKIAELMGITRVKIKNIHTGHGFFKPKEEVRPNEDRFRRHFRRSRLCGAPYRHVLVYFNGACGLCCVDYNNCCNTKPDSLRGFVEKVRSREVKWRRVRAILKGWGICERCEMSGALGMAKEVWL